MKKKSNLLQAIAAWGKTAFALNNEDETLCDEQCVDETINSDVLEDAGGFGGFWASWE